MMHPKDFQKLSINEQRKLLEAARKEMEKRGEPLLKFGWDVPKPDTPSVKRKP